MPASATLKTHELYAEQLLPLQLGYPLYDPDPGAGLPEVQIGDVGFIFHGRFMRFANVFSVTIHEDSSSSMQIPAVPENRSQIVSFTNLDKGVLSSHNVHSEGVELQISATESISGASVGAGFNITCQSNCGASLITRFKSTVEKSFYPNVIGRHFTKYRQTYFKIAQVQDLPVNRLNDIFVISGRVMTGDWATIAFQDRSEETVATFNITVNTITASGTIWGKWSQHINYPKRHGPIREREINDSDMPELNQCIFIDTIRTYERVWFEQLKAFVQSLRSTASHKAPAQDTKPPLGADQEIFQDRPSSSQQHEEVIFNGKPRFHKQDTLSPYDILAFHAFNTTETIFDLICITEDDVKRTTLGFCLIEHLETLPAYLNFNVKLAKKETSVPGGSESDLEFTEYSKVGILEDIGPWAFPGPHPGLHSNKSNLLSERTKSAKSRNKTPCVHCRTRKQKCVKERGFPCERCKRGNLDCKPAPTACTSNGTSDHQELRIIWGERSQLDSTVTAGMERELLSSIPLKQEQVCVPVAPTSLYTYPAENIVDDTATVNQLPSQAYHDANCRNAAREYSMFSNSTLPQNQYGSGGHA